MVYVKFIDLVVIISHMHCKIVNLSSSCNSLWSFNDRNNIKLSTVNSDYLYDRIFAITLFVSYMENVRDISLIIFSTVAFPRKSVGG